MRRHTGTSRQRLDRRPETPQAGLRDHLVARLRARTATARDAGYVLMTVLGLSILVAAVAVALATAAGASSRAAHADTLTATARAAAKDGVTQAVSNFNNAGAFNPFCTSSVTSADNAYTTGGQASLAAAGSVIRGDSAYQIAADGTLHGVGVAYSSKAQHDADHSGQTTDSYLAAHVTASSATGGANHSGSTTSVLSPTLRWRQVASKTGDSYGVVANGAQVGAAGGSSCPGFVDKGPNSGDDNRGIWYSGLASDADSTVAGTYASFLSSSVGIQHFYYGDYGGTVHYGAATGYADGATGSAEQPVTIGYDDTANVDYGDSASGDPAVRSTQDFSFDRTEIDHFLSQATLRPCLQSSARLDTSVLSTVSAGVHCVYPGATINVHDIQSSSTAPITILAAGDVTLTGASLPGTANLQIYAGGNVFFGDGANDNAYSGSYVYVYAPRGTCSSAGKAIIEVGSLACHSLALPNAGNTFAWYPPTPNTDTAYGEHTIYYTEDDSYADYDSPATTHADASVLTAAIPNQNTWQPTITWSMLGSAKILVAHYNIYGSTNTTAKGTLVASRTPSSTSNVDLTPVGRGNATYYTIEAVTNTNMVLASATTALTNPGAVAFNGDITPGHVAITFAKPVSASQEQIKRTNPSGTTTTVNQSPALSSYTDTATSTYAGDFTYTVTVANGGWTASKTLTAAVPRTTPRTITSVAVTGSGSGVYSTSSASMPVTVSDTASGDSWVNCQTLQWSTDNATWNTSAAGLTPTVHAPTWGGQTYYWRVGTGTLSGTSCSLYLEWSPTVSSWINPAQQQWNIAYDQWPVIGIVSHVVGCTTGSKNCQVNPNMASCSYTYVDPTATTLTSGCYTSQGSYGFMVPAQGRSVGGAWGSSCQRGCTANNLIWSMVSSSCTAAGSNPCFAYNLRAGADQYSGANGLYQWNYLQGGGDPNVDRTIGATPGTSAGTGAYEVKNDVYGGGQTRVYSGTYLGGTTASNSADTLTGNVAVNSQTFTY